MGRIRSSLVFAIAALLIGGAQAPAADSSADAVLKAKGLTRVGTLYLLDADVNLRAGLKTMRQARVRLESAVGVRSEIEGQIRAANAAVLQGYARIADLDARMTKVKDVPMRYNELAGQAQALEGQLTQAKLYVEDRQKALARVHVPNDEYVSAVVEESDRMEASQHQYEALATDPAVTAALAQINKAAKPAFKLGPSDAFKQELPSVRRERWKIRAEGIKLSFDGGVPTVGASLNGKANVRMVVDSGAADVFLSANAAHDAGLDEEPAIGRSKGIAADGKVMDTEVKILKSLRVGQFEVQNILCAIAPKGEGDMNLLGGEFLHHFVYRMDLEARELYLSAIGATEEKGGAGPVSPEPSAGSTPQQSPAVPRPGATTTPAGPSAPAVPVGSGKLVSRYLCMCADDFVVDVYVNGRRVEDDRRKVVTEHYGATAERVDVELHAGDWIVFNVVNDRLRWDGAKYFAAAGMRGEGDPAFWTEASSGAWVCCDAPAGVDEFIARPAGGGARAEAIRDHKWGFGDRYMKDLTKNWHGEGLWTPGTARNIWIKFVVPEPRS